MALPREVFKARGLIAAPLHPLLGGNPSLPLAPLTPSTTPPQHPIRPLPRYRGFAHQT
jgi:hypothetical protein